MARIGKRRRVARCVFRDGTGAAVIVAGKEHRYPPGMRTEELEDERDRLERHYALYKPPKTNRGTFAADVETFLLTIPDGPSRSTRRGELAGWVALFGKRHRYSIRPSAIRQQMATWVDEGVNPSTINRRLTALRSLFRDLAEHEHAPNPVKFVKKLQEPDPQMRDVPIDVIHRIVEAMPDRGRPEDGTRSTINLTKLRLRVIAWTGFPPATLGRVTRDDLYLEDSPARVRVRKRRKGRGMKATWLDLLPEAAMAFRSLVGAGGLGPFSPQAMNHAFLRAGATVRIAHAIATVPCPRCQVLPGKACGRSYALARVHPERLEAAAAAPDPFPARVTPYQIRHSFLTMLALVTKDERAVQEYAQHADSKTTRRYTERSVGPRVSHGIAKLSAYLLAHQPGTPGAAREKA